MMENKALREDEYRLITNEVMAFNQFTKNRVSFYGFMLGSFNALRVTLKSKNGDFICDWNFIYIDYSSIYHLLKEILRCLSTESRRYYGKSQA